MSAPTVSTENCEWADGAHTLPLAVSHAGPDAQAIQRKQERPRVHQQIRI